MFKLTGKIAIVTGAASGIGAEIATLFARAGAHVYVADRDQAGAVRLASQIGEKTSAVAVDVSVESECAAAAAKVYETSGRLDILVNNAGIGTVGNLMQATSQDMDRMYAVNVRGVFNMAKAFLPDMVKRHSGNIINMASIGGILGIRDRVAYCTTKFAVVGLTKSMALDHAADGVRVNCICPGRVETPFVQARLKEYPDPEEARREMSATQLLGRMIRPEEVAAAALYLAADESSMVTGTSFLIDGGWSAGK